MSASVYVGLDIGTTSIKVAAVTKQLETVFEKQYAYDYLVPQKGWTEIEPDTWGELVIKGLKELFQHVPAETVAGIGITGQMHDQPLCGTTIVQRAVYQKSSSVWKVKRRRFILLKSSRQVVL